jgi:dUTP pyrophosphatase
MELKIKKLNPNGKLPTRADPGSSGWDLYAIDAVFIDVGATKMVGTGLAMEVPVGYEIQIRPRSGLAAKNGVTVLNTPGTVDASYRGHVQVLLHNTGPNIFWVHPGDRIAQAVVCVVPPVELVEVSELSDTMRGEGGFGSTGR